MSARKQPENIVLITGGSPSSFGGESGTVGVSGGIHVQGDACWAGAVWGQAGQGRQQASQTPTAGSGGTVSELHDLG